MQCVRDLSGKYIFTKLETTDIIGVVETGTPRNRYATGYGAKIPTRYMIQCTDGKRRRVYVSCYSNVGTAYILYGREKVLCEDAIDAFRAEVEK